MGKSREWCFKSMGNQVHLMFLCPEQKGPYMHPCVSSALIIPAEGEGGAWRGPSS